MYQVLGNACGKKIRGFLMLAMLSLDLLYTGHSRLLQFLELGAPSYLLFPLSGIRYFNFLFCAGCSRLTML